MSKLTEREIRELSWREGEKYGLVNTETKVLDSTSKFEEFPKNVLSKIREGHPLYGKLELVNRPE
jgi:hypothetical protein